MIRFLFACAACALCFAQVRLTPKNPAPPAHTRPAKPAPTPATPAAQGAKPKTDAEIEKDFRERLKRSKLAASGFTIRVQGGVATLEGSTNVVQHKGVATRMAKSAGAKAVVNRIRVSDEARAKSSENLDLGRRRQQRIRSETERGR